MLNKSYKAFAFILAVITVLSLMPCGVMISSVSALESGKCGEDLTWTLDDSGKLTVSGTGKMEDYSQFNGLYAPWYPLKDSIKIVVIEDGAESIGNEAFFNCSAVTDVTVSGSVASIGNCAFEYCYSLNNMTMREGVAAIGDNAFNGCYALRSVTIPESVTTIGYGGFNSCGNIKIYCFAGSAAEEYAIEYGLEYEYVNTGGISGKCGDSLDWELDADGKLTISGSGKMTDYHAGENEFAPWYRLRSNIKTAVIENGAETIGAYAFYYCENLTGITVPDSVAEIKEYAFYYCDGMKDVNIGINVASIGDYAFEFCGRISSLTIPDSVKSIGEYAFCYCGGLADVIIGKGVEVISAYAFCYCIGLINVSIPYGVEYIGANAFENCASLTCVSIPGSVAEIGDDAFDYCFSLNRVDITDVACWCEIEFGNYRSNPLSYARCLYLNGEIITDLDIPDGVVLINDFAFYGCESIQSVTIPDSVLLIGGAAFYACVGISEVLLPESVIFIGDCVFADCLSLERITAADGNGYYSSDDFGVLFDKGKTKLIQYPAGNTRTEYTVPDGTVEICYGAFSSSSNLASVTIPGSVAAVCSYAFSSCTGLTSVTIKEGVALIDYLAFSDCTGLKSVTIPASVTTMGGGAFGYNYTDRFEKTEGFKIYCYANTVGAKYAKENGFDYELIKTLPGITPGDLNGDGEADSLDASLLLRYDAGIKELDEKQLSAAELNGDGAVDSSDAAVIIRYDCGLTDKL